MRGVNKKAILFVLLIMLPVYLACTHPVWAEETIELYVNGVVLGTDKIESDGITYTFIDDIDGSIEVHADDIIIDGAGYTLNGKADWADPEAEENWGIYVPRRSNVTVINLQITNFSEAIHLGYSSNNNTFFGNYIEDCESAFSIWDSSFNNVVFNTIKSTNIVVFFGSSNNMFYGNNITIASVLFYFHGKENIFDGNYWINYTGIDSNGDGIGDTPHCYGSWGSAQYFDDNPLMEPTVLPEVVIPEFPSWIILPLFLAATAFALAVRKKRLHNISQAH